MKPSLSILLLFIFSMITSFSQDLNGSWFFKGYTQNSTGNAAGTLSEIDGTVTISPGSINIQLANALNYSGALTFQLSNGVYTFRDSGLNPHDRSQLEYSTNLSIRPVDEDTCILIYGEADYFNFGGTSNEALGVAGILTKSEVLTPSTTPNWNDQYSGQQLILKDQFMPSTLNEINLGVEQLTAEIQQQNTVGSLVYALTNGDRGKSDFAITSHKGHYEDLDADDYLEQADAGYNYYHDLSSEQSKALYLPDGRILNVYYEVRLMDARGISDGNGNKPADYDFVTDFETNVSLLSPASVGTIEEVGAEEESTVTTKSKNEGVVLLTKGRIFVVRNGIKVEIEKGDKVYEGDVILTNPKSFTKITMADNSKFTIGPKSRITLKEMKKDSFDQSKFNLFNVLFYKLKGASRSYFKMDSGNSLKEKYRIQTKHAAIGVRGTSFTIDLTDDGVCENTLLSVEAGIVDTTLMGNSNIVTTLAGGQYQFSRDLETYHLTINEPTPLNGQLTLNGELIESYPHVISLQEGSEITLKAVREAGYHFSGWTGDLVSGDSDIYFILDSSMTISGSFETLDLASTSYDGLWPQDSGHGLFTQLPEGDVNNDGVPNGLAYALGNLPTDTFPTSKIKHLPRSVKGQNGVSRAMQFSIPSDAPDDAIFNISGSSNLGEWSQIARKEANANWVSSTSETVTQETETNGFRPTSIDFPSDPQGQYFMRLEVEIDD